MSAADCNELEAAARAWDALAEDERRGRDLGVCLVQAASLARERMYRRTAEALRIEDNTGVAVCSCCHQPFGRRPLYLMSQDDLDALSEQEAASHA